MGTGVTRRSSRRCGSNIERETRVGQVGACPHTTKGSREGHWASGVGGYTRSSILPLSWNPGMKYTRKRCLKCEWTLRCRQANASSLALPRRVSRDTFSLKQTACSETFRITIRCHANTTLTVKPPKFNTMYAKVRATEARFWLQSYTSWRAKGTAKRRGLHIVSLTMRRIYEPCPY